MKYSKLESKWQKVVYVISLTSPRLEHFKLIYIIVMGKC